MGEDKIAMKIAELSKMPKVKKHKSKEYVVDSTTDPELLFEKRYVLSYADYKLLSE